MRPTLPSADPDPSGRAARLNAARDAYGFAYDWPPGVATAAALPKGEGYGAAFTLRSVPIYLEIGANLAGMAVEDFESADHQGLVKQRLDGITEDGLLEHLLALPKELAGGAPLVRPGTWEGYQAEFVTWPRPAVVAAQGLDPSADRSFAWQRIAGVNPMVLARAPSAPAALATDRFAASTGGDSAPAAAAEGRLFVADYSSLAGLTAGTTDGLRKWVPAPTAWFVVDRASGALLPVAILPAPGGDLIWRGDGWRWVMARAAVQSADANVHEAVVHLGRTHLVMEAVGLCLHRQLSDAHPLYVLLSPHVATTFAINHSAKTSLIAPGGTVDRCFAAAIDSLVAVVHDAVSTYALDRTDPPTELADRGLSDLAVHPYRDAALPLWDALREFTAAYVALYYPTDADVVGDPELRAFLAELASKDGGRLVGVPVVDSRERLAWLLARLIFVAGPQHSAVNFPQFDHMAYPPNMPGALWAPPPTRDTPDDPASFLELLPPWRTTLEGSTMVYLLSNVRNSRFGDYGLLHFTDLRVHPVVHAFQERLVALEAADAAADASRPWSYPYLRPSRILQSVSI